MIFFSERLLTALREAGEDGLLLSVAEQLVPKLEWRLGELRRHGVVVGREKDRLYLVHDGVASSESPAPGTAPCPGLASGTGRRPPTPVPALAGDSLDATLRLFDPAPTPAWRDAA